MRLPPLKLRRGDRAILESWTRAGTVEARVAKRARIVLLAAEGHTNRYIGELVDLHYNQVGIWRQRAMANTGWPASTTPSAPDDRACMTMTMCCCS